MLYALGVYAAETGWLERLTPAQVRQLGWLAATAAATLVALFGAEMAWGDVDVLLEATSLSPTMLLAGLDGWLAVTWTLWCVAWFRRRWTHHGALLGKASRASYATYFIHPLVLTTLMVPFATAPLPPELKFVVIAALGVPACFAISYRVIRSLVVSKVF